MYARWVEGEQAGVGSRAFDQLSFEVVRIQLLLDAGLVEYARAELSDLQYRLGQEPLFSEEHDELIVMISKIRGL